MTTAWMTLLIVLLVCALIAGCVLTAFGLPGNWFSVLVAAVYNVLVPETSTAYLGWGLIVAMFVLAALGEVIEFIAGALGVTKQGGSRRSALLSLGGSLVGAVIGAIVGLPIPVIGSVAGVVIFSAVGAFVGAIYGEYMWMGRDANASTRVAIAAFWGRLFGTAAKILMGVGILALGIAGLVLGP